jgi:hypothetical protein
LEQRNAGKEVGMGNSEGTGVREMDFKVKSDLRKVESEENEDMSISVDDDFESSLEEFSNTCK